MFWGFGLFWVVGLFGSCFLGVLGFYGLRFFWFGVFGVVVLFGLFFFFVVRRWRGQAGAGVEKLRSCFDPTATEG